MLFGYIWQSTCHGTRGMFDPNQVEELPTKSYTSDYKFNKMVAHDEKSEKCVRYTRERDLLGRMSYNW